MLPQTLLKPFLFLDITVLFSDYKIYAENIEKCVEEREHSTLLTICHVCCLSFQAFNKHIFNIILTVMLYSLFF
jgi:hypothetical protein